MRTGSQNATTCGAFLGGLLERGLRIADGVLVVLDEGKGLRRAVREVVEAQALFQRCGWHKRENVVAYLPKHLQATRRAKLQHTYRQPTYTRRCMRPWTDSTRSCDDSMRMRSAV